MQLVRLDPEHLDEGDLADAVAVLEAARQTDAPHETPEIPQVYAGALQHGWDGEPPQAWVARGEDGTAVGVLEVELPERDNRHLGGVQPVVHPALRRRGIGRQLFERGVELVRSANRRLVLAEAWDLEHTMNFARAVGMERASPAVERRQYLDELDWVRLEGLHAQAEAAAAGYELLRVPGETPDELMDGVVAVTASINDAPTDDLDIEDEIFDVDRIKAFERAQRARGVRLYRVIARTRDGGEIAGHTVMGADDWHPEHGSQLDTAVARGHRGHRLGLLLKLDMLFWLREVEPKVRVVDTWNAASNVHMIDVNQALGYVVVGRASEWQCPA